MAAQLAERAGRAIGNAPATSLRDRGQPRAGVHLQLVVIEQVGIAPAAAADRQARIFGRFERTVSSRLPASAPSSGSSCR